MSFVTARICLLKDISAMGDEAGELFPRKTEQRSFIYREAPPALFTYPSENRAAPQAKTVLRIGRYQFPGSSRLLWGRDDRTNAILPMPPGRLTEDIVSAETV
jgi:hypothetical protein